LEEDVKGRKSYISDVEPINSMKVVVICGSGREHSRVRSLMKYVGEILENQKIKYETIDVRNTGMPFFEGKDPSEWNEETQNVMNRYVDADVYFIGSPVYFSGYSGGLKNLIDYTPWKKFQEKKRVAGIVMSGRTRQHSLVIDSQLRPILIYLGINVANKSVFSIESDFIDSGFELENLEVKNRIEEMVKETIKLWKNMK